MNYPTTLLPRGDRSSGPVDRLARGLGWFSLGLGFAELIAAGGLARVLGLKSYEPIFRAYGVREIMSGIGALSIDRGPAIWSRVGGDMLDIATLTTGLRDDNPKKDNVGVALAAVIGVTLLDLYCAQQLSKSKRRPNQPVRDYSDRSGFKRPPNEMRGAARDFKSPPDMRAAPRLTSVPDRAPG
jgi:hypothetical protein